MKKIILSAMLAIFCQVAFCQTSYSQNRTHHAQGKNRTPEERASMRVKKMTQDLALTSDQATKVKAIILDRMQKFDAIRAKYATATDKKPMHQEMKALNDQKESELKAVLTPEQYAKHVQIREAQKQKRKQNKQKGPRE
jgi:protein CpxP